MYHPVLSVLPSWFPHKKEDSAVAVVLLLPLLKGNHVNIEAREELCHRTACNASSSHLAGRISKKIQQTSFFQGPPQGLRGLRAAGRMYMSIVYYTPSPSSAYSTCQRFVSCQL